MSTKVKPIPDPEDKKGKPIAFPSQMKMRELKTYGRDADGKDKRVVELPKRITDEKIKHMEQIGSTGTKIDVLRIASNALDSIESLNEGTSDPKGFTIGRNKKIFCGHVIQTVKKGEYSRIGGGQSLLMTSPPVKLGSNNALIFVFDKKRQLAIKVGNKVGKDWAVVVGGNGCIHMDTGSYATFNMPIFVVEPTGEYYKIELGNRILLLGGGHHLLLYTKEAPILFIRKHTITHQKSIPKSLENIAPIIEKKENSKNEPKVIADEVITTPHETEQTVGPKVVEEESNEPPLVPPQPTVEEDSKQSSTESVKEIKGLTETSDHGKKSEPSFSITAPTPEVAADTVEDKKSEPSLSVTAPTPAVAADTEEDESNQYMRWAVRIGIILLILFCLFLLYRFCWKATEVKNLPSGKPVVVHHHINRKLCKICKKNYV